jgi:hypothetical protein
MVLRFRERHKLSENCTYSTCPIAQVCVCMLTKRSSIYDNMRYLNDKYPPQNHQIPVEHPAQGVDNGANFTPVQT